MESPFLKRAASAAGLVSLLLFLWAGTGFCGNSTVSPATARVLSRAGEFLEKGEAQEAAAMLRNYLEEKPESSYLVDALLGNALLLMEEREQAAAAFGSALKKNPDFLPARKNLGKALYEQGNYKEASKTFLKVYEKTGNKEPDWLFLSAQALALAGENESSEELFKRLFSDHPDDLQGPWLEGRVRVLIALDRDEDALPFLATLASETPENTPNPWQGVLSSIYLKLGMKDEANSLLDRRLEKEPENPKWWRARARMKLEAGRETEAIADLSALSLLTPLEAAEKRILADLLLKNGMPSRASVLYEEILSRGWDRDAALNLIAAQTRLGYWDKALSVAEQGLEGDDAPRWMRLKADLLYNRGQYAKAASWYTRSAEQGHESGQSWLLAGYAAWQAGDPAAAARAFSRAREFPQTREPAEKALSSLRPATPKP